MSAQLVGNDGFVLGPVTETLVVGSSVLTEPQASGGQDVYCTSHDIYCSYSVGTGERHLLPQVFVTVSIFLQCSIKC